VSSSDDVPQLLAFQAIAAARGDGLHPLLAEALAKTGSVSGPPAASEQTDDNVVRLEFGSPAAGLPQKDARRR